MLQAPCPNIRRIPHHPSLHNWQALNHRHSPHHRKENWRCLNRNSSLEFHLKHTTGSDKSPHRGAPKFCNAPTSSTGIRRRRSKPRDS